MFFLHLVNWWIQHALVNIGLVITSWCIELSMHTLQSILSMKLHAWTMHVLHAALARHNYYCSMPQFMYRVYNTTMSYHLNQFIWRDLFVCRCIFLVYSDVACDFQGRKLGVRPERIGLKPNWPIIDLFLIEIIAYECLQLYWWVVTVNAYAIIFFFFLFYTYM